VSAALSDNRGAKVAIVSDVKITHGSLAGERHCGASQQGGANPRL